MESTQRRHRLTAALPMIGAAAGLVWSAAPTAAQTAYFSLTGDFVSAGDQLDFGIDLDNLGSLDATDDFGFQTFANAGGTNRAGDTIAAGGIDSIVELTNPFVSGNFGVNDDYDNVNNGLDSLLTWPGSTPNPAGDNIPLDENNFAPSGLNNVRLREFGGNNAGAWALDLFSPAENLTLLEVFQAPGSTGTATVQTLKFGTDPNTPGAGHATVDIDQNYAILGDVVVGQTGRAQLDQSGGTFTVGGSLTVRTADTYNLTGGTLDADGGVTVSGGIFNRNGGALDLAAGQTFNVTSNGAATFTGDLLVDDNQTFLADNGGDLTVTGELNINASGTLTVDADSTLDADGDINVNGGVLSSSAAGFDVAANRTATVSNDGQLNLNSGVYTLAADKTIAVETGGDFTTTNGLDLGNVSAGTVTVDGPGSSLNVGPGNTFWGLFGGTGAVTLSNQATGSVGTSIQLATLGDNSTGSITVDSDADLEIRSLRMATDASDADGTTATVTVTGAGSSITQISQTVLEVGGTGTGSTATLNINNGGTFNTGTGDSSIRPTGTINLAGGTLNVNHQLYVDGGTFTQTAGELNLPGGVSLIVRDAGLFDWTGGGPTDSLTLDQDNVGIAVSGPGSRFRHLSGGDALLTVSANVMITVNGGTLETDHLLLNNGSLQVVGNGATLTATTGTAVNLHQVGFGDEASLRIAGGATADLRLGAPDAALIVGQFADRATVDVQSGSTLDIDSLSIQGAAVTVTGAGSQITQSAAAALTVGNLGGPNTGTLDVLDGASFTAGSGVKTVNARGVVNVADGGVLNLNGTLTNNGLLRGNGGIVGDVDNNGTLILDSDTNGDLSINGGYTQTATGRLEIGATGVTGIPLDAVEVSGALNLAGEIAFVSHDPATDFEALPLYDPTQVVTFNSTSLTGVFDTVAGHVLTDGTAIAVVYGLDVGWQRVLHGDANRNQLVEQGDLNAVLNNWGKTNLGGNSDRVSWATGDLNGNGLVEQGDLNAVLNNWGDTVNAPDFSGFAVPEPGAALALLLLPTLAGRRRRPDGSCA